MKKKEMSNRLLTVTLAASLVAGNAPLTVNAAETASGSNIQNQNDNTENMQKVQRLLFRWMSRGLS